MKVAILATTFSGNKGAAAMLKGLIKNLSPNYEYQLLSVYPEEDLEQNPYKNITVVNAKPERMIFIAFPLAIIYYLISCVQPIKKILVKNSIIKSISESDLIVDQAGVSFVDSRGFIMNTYNFICIAIPLLLSKRVVKYSQAMGPFENIWNRAYAKIVLPKLFKICARGNTTWKHLVDLKLKNIELCADGAFIMPDAEISEENIRKLIKDDIFYKRDFITISISSVVESYCSKIGINYKDIMVQFINYIIEKKGYGVLIIANAAREGKTSRKNNDLPVCRQIYNRIKKKDYCNFYDKEFTPEEIREMIGKSKMMVASRFHAMIGALYKEVPILLIGWSHKYQEVLDMFSIGKNAIDYKMLSLETLIEEFNRLEKEEHEIRLQIKKHLSAVQSSAMKNIEIIKDALRQV